MLNPRDRSPLQRRYMPFNPAMERSDGPELMPISNAEKQRRYRLRHLGPGGGYERVSVVVRIAKKRNLERLAGYHGYTITGMVEALINEKTQSLLETLSEREQHDFYLG